MATSTPFRDPITLDAHQVVQPLQGSSLSSGIYQKILLAVMTVNSGIHGHGVG